MNAISDAGYDILKPPERAYVFLSLDKGWVPVGLVKVNLEREGRPSFTFIYGRSWMKRSDAFPLDPIHLPFGPDVDPQNRMFGAFLDASPDRWGTRLLDEHYALLLDEKQKEMAASGKTIRGRKIPTAMDRLLLAGDDRVGALAFGPTEMCPLLRPAAVPIRDLADIEAAMVRFDAGEIIEKDLRLLATGTSMGGARPKATSAFPTAACGWRNSVAWAPTPSASCAPSTP